MASRNGRAMAAPAPRRKVRRGRCVPVMKFIGSVSLGLPSFCRFPGGRVFRPGTGLIGVVHGFREFHTEWVALHDPEDERRNLVSARFGGLGDGPDGGLIVVLDPTAEGVGHQVL